jgi:N-acyl homoserine lactone hydrolase
MRDDGGMPNNIVVEALDLGSVQLPDSHPWAADAVCVVQGFVIRHPDGVILVDTGVGTGNDFIDATYRPTVVSIHDALHRVEIDERDVVAIVNTHLHFDHCGQNSRLPRAAVYIQRVELEAAVTEYYTVREWAAVEPSRLRAVDGDESIAPSVTLIATPGHTPGHQSVVVDSKEGRPTIVVGQACYSCTQFESGTNLDGDLHDVTWRSPADESLARLRSLNPTTAHFSHDRALYRST